MPFPEVGVEAGRAAQRKGWPPSGMEGGVVTLPDRVIRFLLRLDMCSIAHTDLKVNSNTYILSKIPAFTVLRQE